MLDPGYTHLHDYDRPPIKRPPIPPRLSQINSMPYTYYPAPPAPPAPVRPEKKPSDNDLLSLFTTVMLTDFPDHDLTYSFKTEQFVDPKTNDMFKIWKLGQKS